MPKIDRILSHLDKLRPYEKCVEIIIAVDDLLQNLKEICSDYLKTHYEDLFELKEKYEAFQKIQEQLEKTTSDAKPSKKQQQKRVKQKIVKKMQSRTNTTSDSDFDDPDANRQPPRKKQKSILSDELISD